MEGSLGGVEPCCDKPSYALTFTCNDAHWLESDLKIVGICRFSFLGRGDWKPYQGKPDADIDDVIEQQATVLFADARMESRFATFEHLTLASFRAQSDQDFKLIVLASELMPEPYKKKLMSLCGTVPQVKLRFLPPMDVPTAQHLAFKEFDLKYNEVRLRRLCRPDEEPLQAPNENRGHFCCDNKWGDVFLRPWRMCGSISLAH